MEGLTSAADEKHLWYTPGQEFRAQCATGRDWLGAKLVSFWWD